MFSNMNVSKSEVHVSCSGHLVCHLTHVVTGGCPRAPRIAVAYLFLPVPLLCIPVIGASTLPTGDGSFVIAFVFVITFSVWSTNRPPDPDSHRNSRNQRSSRTTASNASALDIADTAFTRVRRWERRHCLADSTTLVNMTPPLDRLPTTEKGTYENAAVSADSTQCAQIGCDILQMGGSAVDAAIATLLAVGVVNAHSMGLGGGFLMTVYQRDLEKAEVIDAREVAPSHAARNMFQGNLNLTLRGGLSVAVPGELGGYWEAHQRYGKLKWSDLFQPAIRICREGHSIGFHMANALRVTRDHILNEPSMGEIYLDPETGDIKKENDVVRRPVLAETLEIIAQKGASVLYNGELGSKLVRDVQNLGGIIALEDLANYKPLVKEPVVVHFEDGRTMYNVPPPGSGSLMAMILNILDGYHLSEQSVHTEDDVVLLYHRFIEACKFTYARRTELGDDNFVDVKELLRNVTSKDYAESVRERIVDNTTFDPDYYGAVLYQPDDYGTAHVAVIASNGDAVSVTSSINQYFGAKIRSSSTGIILNNVMGDFSAPNITNYFGLPPSPANFIEPGKRPLSSMCPAIFVDEVGDVILVIGAAGGTRITSGTSLVALRNLWLKEDIQTAIDHPRIHHQLFPQQLMYEKNFNEIGSRCSGIGVEVFGKFKEFSLSYLFIYDKKKKLFCLYPLYNDKK